MGMTYFKRFRMEYRLDDWSYVDAGDSDTGISRIESFAKPVPAGYEFVPFHEGLISEHALAKYESFRYELDANVFPCLGDREGCVRLMKEIAGRHSFVAEATWLCRYRNLKSRSSHPRWNDSRNRG